MFSSEGKVSIWENMRYVHRFKLIHYIIQQNCFPLVGIFLYWLQINYIQIQKQIIFLCVSFYFCVKILNVGYVWSKKACLFMVFEDWKSKVWWSPQGRSTGRKQRMLCGAKLRMDNRRLEKCLQWPRCQWSSLLEGGFPLSNKPPRHL